MKLALIVSIILQLGSAVARANIVYNVDTTITSSVPTGNASQEDAVVGTITTNGTIGALTQADILSWNLNLIDQLNSANDSNSTPADSYIYFAGNGLTATATGLFFNFNTNGLFAIASGYNNGSAYFCFDSFTTGLNADECYTGESIAPYSFFYDGVCTDSVVCGSAAPFTGTVPLNGSSSGPPPPPPPSSVPEPSTFGMVLGVGLVCTFCGLVRRERAA